MCLLKFFIIKKINKKLNAVVLACAAPKEYLLLSQKTEISRLVMRSDTTDDSDNSDEVDNPEVTLPIHGLKNIKALTYDPVQQHIYWVEGRQKIIKRAHDNGTNVSLGWLAIVFSCPFV